MGALGHRKDVAWLNQYPLSKRSGRQFGGVASGRARHPIAGAADAAYVTAIAKICRQQLIENPGTLEQHARDALQMRAVVTETNEQRRHALIVQWWMSQH